MYARDHALIATPLGTIRIEGDDAQIASVRIGTGALGRYSGGDGPKTKSWLLEHERRFSAKGTLL